MRVNVLRLVPLDAAAVVVEIGCNPLQHLELLTGLLTCLAQLAKQQSLGLVGVLGELEPEIMRRRSRLENHEIIKGVGRNWRLTPSIPLPAQTLSPRGGGILEGGGSRGRTVGLVARSPWLESVPRRRHRPPPPRLRLPRHRSPARRRLLPQRFPRRTPRRSSVRGSGMTSRARSSCS